MSFYFVCRLTGAKLLIFYKSDMYKSVNNLYISVKMHYFWQNKPF